MLGSISGGTMSWDGTGLLMLSARSPASEPPNDTPPLLSSSVGGWKSPDTSAGGKCFMAKSHNTDLPGRNSSPRLVAADSKASYCSCVISGYRRCQLVLSPGVQNDVLFTGVSICLPDWMRAMGGTR